MMHKVCLRILLRQCKRINFICGGQNSGSLYLQSIPNPRDEYQQSFTGDLNFELSAIIKKLIPSPIDSFIAKNITSRCITSSQLKMLIISAYDQFKNDKFLNSNALVDLELQCIRLINEQIRISNSSSLQFHRDIRVIATAVYFKSESTPPFSFFYRITLENLSSHTWRLRGRYWLFECSKGTVEVPKFSQGVIGLTPVIQPGTSFTYMSMTFMDSVPGSMRGSFSMVNEDNGDTFELPAGPVNLNTELFTE